VEQKRPLVLEAVAATDEVVDRPDRGESSIPTGMQGGILRELPHAIDGRVDEHFDVDAAIPHGDRVLVRRLPAPLPHSPSARSVLIMEKLMHSSGVPNVTVQVLSKSPSFA